MRLTDVAEFLLLAMIWGSSFMFMRIAAPELGPIALMTVRVAVATLVLMPVLLMRKRLHVMLTHFKPIAITGLVGSAFPFCLLGYSALHFSAGLNSILNATVPLWAGLIAVFILKEKPTKATVVGLLTGYVGVVAVVWEKLTMFDSGSLLALAAGLGAALSYAIGANYTKRALSGVDPMAIATGSQFTSTLMLLPLCLINLPDGPVSSESWMSAAVLGVAGSGLAYILFYRLIDNIGATRAVTVTYLIPLFGMIFGALFINEVITSNMIVGCGLILAGTALASGLLKWPGNRKATAG